MAGDGKKAQGQGRVRMVCAACSSEQVIREAWAEWDPGRQEWRLAAVFDHAFCHRCQMSTHIEPRPIAG